MYASPNLVKVRVPGQLRHQEAVPVTEAWLVERLGKSRTR